MLTRMLTLALLVAVLVGGAPSAGAAAHSHGAAARSSTGRGLGDVPQAVHGSWSWPIPLPHVIARAYLAPITDYAAGHRGIDILAATGADVLAPDAGVVHFAGVVVDRPVLSISHSGGVLSSFEPVTTTLTAGESVVRGEVIGEIGGQTGAPHCSTPCLHLGARVDGAYVNPLLFLGGVPWSVLLPSG